MHLTRPMVVRVQWGVHHGWGVAPHEGASQIQDSSESFAEFG